jgi:Tfp pilus assembly protein PilV
MINLKLNNKGQGFIETLLILLFVALSVIGLVKYQHNLAYRTSAAQQQNDALILAQKQVETLRDFHVLTTTTGYTAYPSIASGSFTTTVSNTTYTIASTVTTTTSPSYKTIDVTVSWTDRVGRSRNVRLSTRVAGIDPATAATVY